MPFDTVFKLGFPGIGLNQSQFDVYTSILTANLHRYNSDLQIVVQNASIIYVQNSTCADLYDSVNDLAFNLTFVQVSDYALQLPLTALMRDKDTDSADPACVFLLTALGEPEYKSLRYSTEYILLGDVFFQNFFAQFSYEMNYMDMGTSGGNMSMIEQPMVLINTKQYSLPGVNIIDLQTRFLRLNDIYTGIYYSLYSCNVLISMFFCLYMVYSSNKETRLQVARQIKENARRAE